MKRLWLASLGLPLALLAALTVYAQTTSYPGGFDSTSSLCDPTPTAQTNLAGCTDAILAAAQNHAVEALEHKVGSGASTPQAGQVLIGTGVGTSDFEVITPIATATPANTATPAATVTSVVPSCIGPPGLVEITTPTKETCLTFGTAVANAPLIAQPSGSQNAVTTTNVGTDGTVLQGHTAAAPSFGTPVPPTAVPTATPRATDTPIPTATPIVAGGGALISGLSLVTGATSLNAGNTTLYVGGGYGNSTEALVQQPVSTAGTASKLYILAQAAAGGGQTTTFTVRNNSSNSTITCQIAGASAVTCNDTTHTLSVAAGDLLAIAATGSAGASGPGVVRASLQVAI